MFNLRLFHQPTLYDLHFVQLMGEKEQAPYSLKERPGPCSVYHTPEGVREILARLETRENSTES